MIESLLSTKERYAMREDTVVQLRQPGTFSEDPLMEIFALWRAASSGAGD